MRPAQIVRKVAETVEKIQSGLPRDRRGPCRECGVSVPGMVDTRSGEIIQRPDLPAYNGFSLGGVGAGMVLKGELYRGHDSTFAAEFGHMGNDPAGPACQRGGRG